MNFDNLTYLPRENPLTEAEQRSGVVRILEGVKGNWKIIIEEIVPTMSDFFIRHSLTDASNQRVLIRMSYQDKGVIDTIIFRNRAVETITAEMNAVIQRNLDYQIQDTEDELAYFTERLAVLKNAKDI